MFSNIDPKMLEGLSETVSDVMPGIHADIEAYILDSTNYELLENAYENIHQVTDIAEMLGLSVLHQIMLFITEMIVEIASNNQSNRNERGKNILDIIDQVQPCLSEIQSGNGSLENIVYCAVAAYHRFKKIPENDDNAIIKKIMSTHNNGIDDKSTYDIPYGKPHLDEITLDSQADNLPTDTDFFAELLDGFLVEAEEYLDIIGNLLPAINDEAKHNENMLQIRRSVHTLKGSAGIIGLQEVSRLSHRMEDLLDELYEGNISLTVESKNLLYATFDTLEAFIRDEKAQGDISAKAQNMYDQYDNVLKNFKYNKENLSDTGINEKKITLIEGEQADFCNKEDQKSLNNNVSNNVDINDEKNKLEINKETAALYAHQASDVLRVPMARVDEVISLMGELTISGSVYEQHLVHLTKQVEELHLSIERLQKSVTNIDTQFEVNAFARYYDLTSQSRLENSNCQKPEWIGIAEFDELELDRYNEFHIKSRDLAETSADIGALGHEFKEILTEFDSYLRRQSRLTNEIQHKLMQFRMIPLASLSTRLHRAVRATSQQRGKNVNFIIEGEEVQFDKLILEELYEALLHILRNAVDHGIEDSQVRLSRGKPQQGFIRLVSYREGTQLVVQLSDDGGGLDPNRIRSTAVKKGLLSESESSQWHDEQIYSLIFTPGFSTANEVSEVSGRGVGMDIVYTTVSRLKGKIKVESTPNVGTTITIHLPLTLAMAKVLFVEASGQSFALPITEVSQVRKIETDKIELMGSDKVIRLDSQVIPIICLQTQLNLQSYTDPPEERKSIVIADVSDKRVAFLVDDFLGVREVVVKNLGSHLQHIHGLIGTTIMGDGSIVPILNLNDILYNIHQTTAKPHPGKSIIAKSSEAFEIMIVDDSFSVRRVVANLIKNMGWHPILAKNGLEALDMIQHMNHPPDLVLLDVEMPHMNGYELTSILRTQTAFQHFPIVMLTSRSGEKHRRKAFESGATEYLVKPYNDIFLIETIKRLIFHARSTFAA